MQLYKIVRYVIRDLLRSRWTYVYFAFYYLLGMVLLFINRDLSKAIITLMNIITILTPLIGTVFGVMYYYNSREFIQLLLAQPLRRNALFSGQYIGVSLSLSLSLILGLGIPFSMYGVLYSGVIWDFAVLLVIGGFLTFIFVGLALVVALANDNRIKGFGYAIFLWLAFAVVYDGLFLLGLLYFRDYPLEKFALGGVLVNPIDLSRILILLKLDIAALMGFTGAVFKKVFGTSMGMLMAFGALLLWVWIPWQLMLWFARRKDF